MSFIQTVDHKLISVLVLLVGQDFEEYEILSFFFQFDIDECLIFSVFLNC